MKFNIRQLAVVAAIFSLGFASVASAAPYTTAGAPASFLTLEVWLGAPGGTIPASDDGEGNEVPSFVTSVIGPLAITGTADLTYGVDGTGNGTFSYNSTSLTIATAVNQLVDLDPAGFGTVLMDLVNVGMGLNSSAVPVNGNTWNLDTDPPASFALALNDGFLKLHSPTGMLGTFITDPPEDPNETIDLTTDPVTVALADLSGFNINGVANDGLVSLSIPGVALDLGADALGIEGLLFLRLVGEVNLVPVPEPSSIALAGFGIVGLVVAAYRRRNG